MSYTFDFLILFIKGLYYAAPILIFLILLITLLGIWVGKNESWSKIDSIYYAFITATTVGYGDFRPSAKSGKFIAIGIALTGILLTGIVVAIAVKAAEAAFTNLYGLPTIS